MTFLVNIWLNYHPYDVKPFPDSMINKMSGTDDKSRRSLVFQSESNPPNENTEDMLIPVNVNSPEEEAAANESNSHSFEWPMGDNNSKEFLEATLPLTSIRKKASTGGNLNLKWEQAKQEGDRASVRLFMKTNAIKSSKKGETATAREVTKVGDTNSEDQAAKRQKTDS